MVDWSIGGIVQKDIWVSVWDFIGTFSMVGIGLGWGCKLVRGEFGRV